MPKSWVDVVCLVFIVYFESGTFLRNPCRSVNILQEYVHFIWTKKDPPLGLSTPC
jgi:hypothetical protein